MRDVGDDRTTRDFWMPTLAVRPPHRFVAVDVEKYQALLDEPSLTDEQKENIISSLWLIVTSLIDLGFGVHPMQQAQDDW